MNLNINIWVILFTCGLVIGVFIMFLFILSRKKYTIHAQNITIILFLISLMLFNEIAEESDLVDHYPFLIAFTIVIDLLIWPFLLFYIQYITKQRNNYRLKDGLYFIPFVIGCIWQFPFLFASNEKKLSYFSNGIPTDVALFAGFKVIIAMLFLAHIINLLNRRLAVLKTHSSVNKQALFIKNAKNLILVFASVALLSYFLFFLNYFGKLPLRDSDLVGSLLITVSLYFFGMLVYKNPKLFEGEHYSKAITNFFDGKETLYIERLLTMFKEQKPYLNEKLALQDVANQIGLSKQQLSYLVNQQLGIPFLSFVNQYRVKEVQERIKSESHLNTTLLTIAYESGFNSKASFNRIFKDQIGISPSDYVKSITK